MDYKTPKKPEEVKKEVWDQHLQWMAVMSKQVARNLKAHRARVERDAKRSEQLSPIHEEVLQSPHRTNDLFSER